MAVFKYPIGSPYYETNQLSWRMDQYKHRSIPKTDTDKTVILDARYHERPDKLADDLYGNAGYWWVFMVRNPDTIKHPLWDFVSGKQIVAPSKEALIRFGL